ncbi:MAG: hypothetical protein ACR2PL_05605 [Dehalococcoidia bacterium]
MGVTVDLQLLLTHLVRCLLLDEHAYDEVRATASESLSALVVVFLATSFAGLGGLLWTFIAADHADHGRFFLRSVVFGSVLQVFFFLVWVLVVAAVLQRIYRVRVTYLELLRVMGYAFSPIGLQLFIFVPALDQPIGIITLAGAFYLATHAIRSTTTATAGQALTASLLGFTLFCAALGILGNGDSDLAPGIFALDPTSLSVGLNHAVLPVKR